MNCKYLCVRRLARPGDTMMHSIAWWPTLIVVLVATITDLRSRRIPNWLVVPFLVGGIVVSTWVHGWHGLGRSLEGLLLGFVIYGILFFLGGMGAGDVKLAAAIGAWIGPVQMFLALIFIALAGGLLAVSWALWGGFLGNSIRSSASLVFGFRKRGSLLDPTATLENPLRRKMPYAPAIAIGTLLSFYSRPLLALLAH